MQRDKLVPPPKSKEYIALNRHDNDYVEGTLASILEELEGNDCDVDEYRFYEKGTAVMVKMEKKLMLVEA